MAWDSLITPISDALKRVFDLVDQMITDKDKAAELKVSIALAEANSKFWLAACWRPLAMLALVGMIITLEIMGRVVPEWAYVIAGVGLIGHLLDKNTVNQVKEIFKKGKK